MTRKDKKTVLVIDGQGGKLGRQIITSIRESLDQVHIIAVGTNAMATSNMIKAKVDIAVTGENAVIHNCKIADIIVGPIGIVIADSLHGEITPAMAQAVGQSMASRVLIPINKCNSMIVGINGISLTKLIESAIETIRHLIDEA